ncbi:hypothetical protein [Streptomyces sp. CB03238]|uniref:hypothetical protein n=1 Tax=Streptomyces sp. CB03238 TaxID=1907777 RepID=UPI000A11AC48|nr:hypothetical protein [Streptomyces sp. CB03238]ORT61627.1 hypothetical protein BKD26_00895 [Streptomyces sp. CB03238]
MARMRRGLVHAMAWSLATGAAVTLSWWGVHTVMAGTAYDPPRALPITADRPAAAPSVAPQASSTRRPEASPAPSATPSASASRTQSRKPWVAPSRPPAPETSAPPASTGEVKSVTVDGGRVAFDIGASSAELVSATPAAGWQMQVWKQPTYIRVTFSKDGRETDVFCTWHDHAPMVQIEER